MKRNILIVVDMQNDFIDGALGTPEAVAIVERVRQRIEAFAGEVYFTRDTHTPDYRETREGRHLPVLHCIRGTHGWEICDALLPYTVGATVIDKPTFGSVELQGLLSGQGEGTVGSITLIGLCTDICVISNAMLLKAAFPEAELTVDAACCAGVTPRSHQNALDAMRMCQINIENA